MSGAPWDHDRSGSPSPGGRSGPPRAVVLLVPVVLAALIQVPAAIGMAVWLGQAPATAALSIGLAVAGPAALLASRRMPGVTIAVVSALALADLLLVPDAGPPYVALGFAIILGVARGAVVWTAVSVGVAWIAAILLGSALGFDWHPFRIAITSAVLAVCFAIGWFSRIRRARADAFRAESARRRQRAEERERVRIARELHDVIGHALSQINVQASVGLHLMDRDPEQARSALGTIKDTSKSALEEVRSVLGVIREGDAPLAPQAELDQLPRLVAGTRAPGLEVTLDDGLPADERPGRAVQFAAYRIAQEALTNVVRHADAARARVGVRRDRDDFVLVVEDDGRGTDADPAVGPGEGAGGPGGLGTGLLGMRERAALLGGSVEIAEADGGGTRITARLPWSTT